MGAMSAPMQNSSVGKRPTTEESEEEVPLLVEKWEHFFDEVELDPDADIRFFFSTAGGHPAVIVTFPRPVLGTADTETAKLSIVEYMDDNIGDLALEVRLNDRYVATFREGGETPWFLDRDQLAESIYEEGRAKTLRDIIAWLIHPFDEIIREVSE